MQNIDLLIVDHYDSIVNKVDMQAETLIQRLMKKTKKQNVVEGWMKQINAERCDLIRQINQIKADALASNSRQLHQDCLLMTDFKYRIQISLWLTNWRMESAGFLDCFDANRRPLKNKCEQLFTDGVLPSGFYCIKLDSLNQQSVKQFCFFNHDDEQANNDESFVKDYRRIDVESLKTFNLNRVEKHQCYFRVQSVRNDAFIEFQNLEILIMSRMNIELIESKSFENLIQLKQIDLSRNRLSQIDEKLFLNLNNLESIDLASNELVSIESKTFNNLHKLTSLDLAYNSLLSIDHSMFLGLENLVRLNFYGNQIGTLESNVFSHLKQLKWLNLSYNTFTQIGRQTFSHLPCLTDLYLIGIKLSAELDSNVFSDLNSLTTILLPNKQANNSDLRTALCTKNPNLILFFQ